LKKRNKKLLSFGSSRAGSRRFHGAAKMPKVFRFFFSKKNIFPILLLASCGDLPQPFAGHPGANALRLANPPAARLTVPPPRAALLPAAPAASLAHDLATALVAQELPAYADTPGPGDWQLRITARLAGAAVQPTYTLLDGTGKNRGSVDGAPVPAATWAAADESTLSAAATAAAPAIMQTLRSVEAAMKQSDPNSLYNRPARIFLAGITGAPGDGDRALAIQLRHLIPQTGDILTSRRADADFILQGLVRATNGAGGQQTIEMHWVVSDPSGKVAGDVAQLHDFPQGALDHYWGDVAQAAASEAAGGIHQVITTWSGRKAHGSGGQPPGGV
jgi:hypothetical protein